MTRQVDARGLPCPHPVINTRKALRDIEEGSITVLVDRPDSSENVQRFARSQGCDVAATERDGVFHLEIVKHQAVQSDARATSQVVLIGTDQLGTGDAVLGKKLLKSFLNTMCDAEPKPVKMFFLNEGVRLTTEGSEVLDALEALENKGVEILSCGTCLEHYDLVERLEVGLVTNMYDIVDSLLSGDNVISI